MQEKIIILGIVVKNISNSFTVRSLDDYYVCTALGKLKQDGKVLVGDRVEIDVVGKTQSVITKVLPRKNLLIRPPIANIDNLVIVLSSSPQPDFILIDKLIIMCLVNDIKPIICINKLDILKDDFVNYIHSQYDNVVLDIVEISAITLENLNALSSLLINKISAFAGQSAVGKSTILNALTQGATAKTGELSLKTNRGRHTTRHTQMYEIQANTFICDTPGFSMLNLENITYNNLSFYYPDFAEFKCKFSGCTHTKEDSTFCAVKKAVEQGGLNKERYDRYVKIYEELKKENAYGKH